MSKTLVPAVAYVRMSTAKQEDSPKRQKEEITRLAERTGYKLVAWYEDHGLTGTESKNRPQFQQLMADAPSGRFRAVLMYEQSRFSREDALDAMLHWRKLRDAGVKLVTCQRGELRFDDLAGLITALVGQHEARGESIRLAQRVLSGRQMKAREGVHLVSTPIGFDREILDESGEVVRRVAAGERFIRPKTWKSRLVPTANRKVLSALQGAFASVIAGRSLRSIAVELNRRGLRTRKGRPFNTVKLERVLRNPVYAGVLRFGHEPKGKFARCDEETILVNDAHRPVVSMATFEEVRSILNARHYSRGASQPDRYLLSRLVYCAHCGRKMGGAAFSLRGRTHRVYRCVVSQNGLDDCPKHPTVPAEALEGLALRQIREHVLVESNHKRLVEESSLLDARRSAPTMDDQRLEELRHRIERGERNLALAEGDNFAAIARQLDMWRQQEKALVSTIRKRKGQETGPSHTTLQTIADIKTLRDNLHLASRAKLAAAVHESVVRITVGRDLVRGKKPVAMNRIFGSIELDPSILPTAIEFNDWELNPDAAYVRVADFVRDAGRPVPPRELSQTGVPNAYYQARRAALVGLLTHREGHFTRAR